MQQQYGPSGTVNRPALTFNGDGGTYFGILILNALLTAVTFGFYYPWAKANKLQYLYASTELEGSRFAWHGTGKEMFKGFLKAVAAVVVFAIVEGLLYSVGLSLVAVIVYIAVLLAVIPYVIHSSSRYHWSRTTWRGIRFGYRGDRNEFIKKFVVDFLLTLVTFGIYGSWMAINIRTYLIGHLRFGSGEFKYEGNGSDYFFLNLKGNILSVLTLGIYSFWWQADVYRYFVDHLSLHHEGKSYRMRSTATGGDFAGLLIVNVLLFIFTIGIASAWIQTRTITFMLSHVEIEGDIDLSQLEQTEEEYRNAMGEDMADLLDLSVI
jgi:uncharacterized membrane protein YjgN (DUF898 family)